MKSLLLITILSLLCAMPSYAAEFPIAAIYSSSTDSDTIEEVMNGASLAEKKLNKAGINIKLLQTVSDDSPERLIEAASSLIRKNKPCAATGTISSDTAITAASVFKSAMTPFLSTGGQTELLTSDSMAFSLASSNSLIGKSLASFVLNDLEAQNIALIASTQNDDSGAQLRAFKSAITNGGAKILTTFTLTEKNADLLEAAKKIAAIKPHEPKRQSPGNRTYTGVEAYDGYAETGILIQKRKTAPAVALVDAIVVIVPAEQCAPVITALNKAGVQHQLAGGTSFDTLSGRKALSSWNHQAFFASQADLQSENKLVQLFIDNYMNEFGTKPVSGYSALGFDSVMILADAISKEGCDKNQIKARLREIKNFKGVSGNISFNGNTGSKPLYILQYVKGVTSLAAEYK